MVDAAASFDGNRLAATEASSRALPRDHAGLSISVASADGLAAYAEFCRSALFAPPQSAAWI
ncbi:MAG: GNAT family N-acetyltransferase, partial [Mesorhizobium sp.]